MSLRCIQIFEKSKTTSSVNLKCISFLFFSHLWLLVYTLLLKCICMYVYVCIYIYIYIYILVLVLLFYNCLYNLMCNLA